MRDARPHPALTILCAAAGIVLGPLVFLVVMVLG
jgi:hypothetical protein